MLPMAADTGWASLVLLGGGLLAGVVALRLRTARAWGQDGGTR
jgi:hypothetical protein